MTTGKSENGKSFDPQFVSVSSPHIKWIETKRGNENISNKMKCCCSTRTALLSLRKHNKDLTLTLSDSPGLVLGLLTVDADVDVRGQSRLGGDGSVGDVTPEYGAVLLLAGDQLQDTHGVAVLVVGQAGVAGQLSPVREAEPGDVRWRRPSSTGAAEAVGLTLHRLQAGPGDGGLAGRQEDGEADGGGVELHPGAVLLHSALELSVVSLVVCVRDVEIIATLGWAGLHPAVITVRTKSSDRGGNLASQNKDTLAWPGLAWS